MKETISKSISNLIKVATAENITEEQKTTLMEVLGTLQGLLILENLKA